MKRRDFAGLAAGAALFGAGRARAQQQRPLRIAVMNDQSGPYRTNAGPGSATAVRLAIADMGGRAAGRPIELVVLDHQNKPDLAASLATRAFDTDGVEAMFDLANSSLSLVVQEIARTRNKVVVHVGSSHDGLYGKQCSPTGALWMYDTYSLARGLARPLVAAGGDTWYAIAVDYTFGAVMVQETERTLQQLGGRMLGTTKHPLGETDYSSYLLSAKASRAKVIMLANASADTVNSIKQAHEFRLLAGGQKLAVPIFYAYNIKALGLPAVQGLQYLEAYYWDRDDACRAFARRFAAEERGVMPGQIHAGCYSAATHYLRAVQRVGNSDGRAVMRAMKAAPLDDFYAPGARIRPDGRLMNDMLLMRAKTPEESKSEWDLAAIDSVVKAEDIIRPLAEGGCPYLDPA